MFDPDNFYEILRCSYAWPNTPNIPIRFVPHGSKQLKDLTPLLADKAENSLKHELSRGDCTAYGKMILHDQEPFSFVDAANTYRDFRINNKKNSRMGETLAALDNGELLNTHFKSGIQPIFCHSELNSSDVKSLVDDCLAIECYYWYHAMIARDWFRHWQHHPDLSICNRGNSDYKFLMYARAYDGSRAYRKDFIDLLQPIKDHVLYDCHNQNLVTPDHSAKINVQDANVSAIHLVLETVFDSTKIHLTEKIFKPMVMSQPFFLLAGPGSLQYLRRYGFRTFADFWDESYDTIADSRARMHAIKNELYRLSQLKQNQFYDLYQSMLPIIEHNRQRFYSQEFQQYCIQEMVDNFELALQMQKNNLEIYPGGPWAKVLSELVERKVFIPDEWKSIAAEFLRSQHLQVPVDKILAAYPGLTSLIV